MYSFHTQLKNVMYFMYTNHGNEKIGLIFCVKIRIETKGLNINISQIMKSLKHVIGIQVIDKTREY